MDEKTRRERLRIPGGKIHLIIDTDTKNEVDDQFAVSYALLSPERFIVDALYAAPFEHPEISVDSTMGVEQSFEELKKLCGLLNKDMEDKIFMGASVFMRDNGGQPVKNPATEDLIRRAREAEDILYVAAIGAPTNIASALLLAPDIKDKIVLIWLGGQPFEYIDASEYNLYQDPPASKAIYDSGVPFVQIPCMGVASLLALTEDEIRYSLKGHTAIADYLADIVLECFEAGEWTEGYHYMPFREDEEEAYLRTFPKPEAVKLSRVIWDVSTIAFLKNPMWIPTKFVETPVLTDALTYEKGQGRPLMKVANYAFRDAIFGDLIYKLTHC